MHTPDSIGQWVRTQRERSSLSRTALCDRIGCVPDTLYKIERNLRRPSPELLERIFDIFEIPAAERPPLRQLGRGLVRDDAPPVAAATPTPPLPPAYVPAPLTSFIDRESALAAVLALFKQASVRLVTLTGPPGVGKTRLSLTSVSHLAPAFPDGVAFVMLDALTDPEQVLPAIAAALPGAGPGAMRQVGVLKEWLSAKQILLVLDNFEHVLPAAALLTDLLSAAPRCKALVTSRTALGVYGEHEYAVPTLRTPPRPSTTPPPCALFRPSSSSSSGRRPCATAGTPPPPCSTPFAICASPWMGCPWRLNSSRP